MNQNLILLSLFSKISSYIYHVDYHHLEHKREIRLNLKIRNSIWIKEKSSLNFHIILTFLTIFTVVLRNDIIIFFFFVIRSLHSLAFAIRNRSLFDFLDLFRTKSRRFLIFFSFRLFFCRDFFLCVDLCFRHVNEIRSLIVIESMIIFIIFVYFVDETKLITLCVR